MCILAAVLMVALFFVSFYLIENSITLKLELSDDGPVLIYRNGYHEYTFASRDIQSDDDKHFYIPSFASEEEIIVGEGISVELDNCIYNEGNKFEAESGTNFVIDGTNYNIAYVENEIIMIDVDEEELGLIKSDKEYETESVELNIINNHGKLIFNTDELSFKCRGNTTFSVDQKSYEINLKDEVDFGLGWQDKYRLVANYNEKTKLKNYVAYTIAEEVGVDGPSVETYNLFINGRYEGLYLLTTDIFDNYEDVEDVNEEHGEFISEDGTGETPYKRIYYYDGNKQETNIEKYCLELDTNVNENEEGFVTTHGIPFLFRKTNDLPREEIIEVAEVFNDLEEALLKEDDSYLDYIDLDSWALKYLLEEVLYNADAQLSSAYYYYDKKENCIYAGPCWDYDNTLIDGTIAQDLRCYYKDTTMGYSKLWYSQLSKKESFMNRVLELYEEKYASVIGKITETYIEYISDQLCHDATLDYELYHNEKMTSDEYYENVEKYKTLLKDHSDFVYEYLQNRDDYVMVAFSNYEVELFRLVHYVIKKGTVFTDSFEIPYDIGDCHIDCWVNSNLEEIDFNQEIYEDLTVYADRSFWSTYNW